jgi:DNA-binding NarL/FixJ family response regulator
VTTVLLVDDHELIRDGLSGIFSAQEDMEVLGAAENVAEALELFATGQPDVVVTDLQLPDGTGLDIVRRVRRQTDKVGLVVLTMHAGDDQIFAAMEAGALDGGGQGRPPLRRLAAVLPVRRPCPSHGPSHHRGLGPTLRA